MRTRLPVRWIAPFALLAALSAIDGAVVEDVVIVAAPDDAAPLVAAADMQPAVDARAAPATMRGEAMRLLWQHPDQTFVDSNLGPLPLYTESVYDGAGNPRPRFPDAFAKAFFDNPTDATALAYLESQRVRVRRYLQASQVMQRVAVEHGYVTPEAFKPPETQLTNNRSLAPPFNYDRADWGVPVMDPQQARLNGLRRDEVPETPGRTTTRYVEVVYLWDHRCPFSMRGYRAFAELSKEVFDRQLGPRLLAVSLDNDQVAVQTQLDFLEYLQAPTRQVENWLDQTDLRRSLHVQRTPTYAFIDRRSGRVLRLEGLQDGATLRATLLELVGHAGADWDGADAAWFRPVEPGLGAGAAPPAQPGDSSAAPSSAGDASPVLPPSQQNRAWDPDGQAD